MSRARAGGSKRSDETRARIFEAALSLFRQRGFESTTMREIAKESSVALGAAYYYFDSKDAIVMAFYQQAQRDLLPVLEKMLSETSGLEERLRSMLKIKLGYFLPNRKLMATLSTHIDPQHPLSPFGGATRSIRDADMVLIARAIDASKARIASDLKPHLPQLLWFYQMGLFLFWVFDGSPGQKRTEQLLDKSLRIVVTLIKFSGLPLLRPLRRVVSELLEICFRENGFAAASPAEREASS